MSALDDPQLKKKYTAAGEEARPKVLLEDFERTTQAQREKFQGAQFQWVWLGLAPPKHSDSRTGNLSMVLLGIPLLVVAVALLNPLMYWISEWTIFADASTKLSPRANYTHVWSTERYLEASNGSIRSSLIDLISPRRTLVDDDGKLPYYYYWPLTIGLPLCIFFGPVHAVVLFGVGEFRSTRKLWALVPALPLFGVLVLATVLCYSSGLGVIPWVMLILFFGGIVNFVCLLCTAPILVVAWIRWIPAQSVFNRRYRKDYNRAVKMAKDAKWHRQAAAVMKVHGKDRNADLRGPFAIAQHMPHGTDDIGSIWSQRHMTDMTEDLRLATGLSQDEARLVLYGTNGSGTLSSQDIVKLSPQAERVYEQLRSRRFS